MSILRQLEEIHHISSAQKHEEYFRFCNMLKRIIAIENLSESIKVIEFDDEKEQQLEYLATTDVCRDTNYAGIKFSR